MKRYTMIENFLINVCVPGFQSGLFCLYLDIPYMYQCSGCLSIKILSTYHRGEGGCPIPPILSCSNHVSFVYIWKSEIKIEYPPHTHTHTYWEHIINCIESEETDSETLCYPSPSVDFFYDFEKFRKHHHIRSGNSRFAPSCGLDFLDLPYSMYGLSMLLAR